jgi:hypothetical protein
VLVFITTHDNEHYGNLVVYLRLKGLVPPVDCESAAAIERVICIAACTHLLRGAVSRVNIRAARLAR